MKTNTFAKRIISVMALMLAVMMLFTACGGGEETSSTESTSSTASNQETDNNNEQNESTPSDTTQTPNAGDSSTAAPQGQTGNNGGTATETTAGWGKAPAGEVHVLMWRDYTKTEKSLVDSYMKKTGVKIRTTVTTEKELTTKLVSLISGGDSPDVVCYSTTAFPGRVVKAMQPLDEKTFRLNDDCWLKTYMDPTKVNGKYFGVAMAKSWSCEDSAYVTYYNKNVLKQCGITTTPFQLYKQGKWNWEKQAEIAKQVTVSGKGNYIGLALHDYGVMMHTANASFVSYDGKNTFVNNLKNNKSNSMLVKAWKEVAKLNEDKVLSSWNLIDTQQGKVGLFTSICYGLYNEGAWFDSVAGGVNSLEAVPIAGPKGSTAYTPVEPKCWGVAKKAKNPEGAAYFLRYWLDVNNCNMSSTFYNKQFETVYNIVCDKNTKKSVLFDEGILDYVSTNYEYKIVNVLGRTTVANIATELDKLKGTVETNIMKANKDLKKVK